MKRFWAGDNLHNLLTKPLDELVELYPEKNRANIQRKQQQYKKQLGDTMERINNGEIPKDELDRLADAFAEAGINFSKEDLAQADRAGFHVGYIRNADGQIEYTKPLPHVDFGQKNKRAEFLLEPVTAALIKPSRMRPAKRDHKLLYVFSDAQIGYRRYDGELHPIHDEQAIRAALMLAKDLNPDFVVDCADTTDFAELSRHPVDSDHFQGTLQPSLQRTHDLFAEFTANTPNAEKRVTVASNHVKRLTDYVLKNSPVMHDIRAVGEKHAAMSYPGLLKLDKIGWEYIDGYPAAEYQYKDDLAFIHGTFAVSGGSTANKLANVNRDRNIVQGHKHSIESHYNTDRRGNIFGAHVVGALCRIDGVVPSYWSSIADNKPVTRYENWQNGIMLIRDYGDGQYQVDQIPIRRGVIHYNGKTYNGTEL